jgi:hypothetical protein
VKRSGVDDREIDRVRQLANDAGVSLRLHVDIEGEVSFESTGLGRFDSMLGYELALADLARVPG